MGKTFLIKKTIRKGALFHKTVSEETPEYKWTLLKNPPIGEGPNIQVNFVSD
jgi:hypothetical protein